MPVCDFEVSVSPQRVDAGSGMTLSARILCDPPEDLRGRCVDIRDAQGGRVGLMPVTAFDGSINVATALRAPAPDLPGLHEWRAVLVAGDGDGAEEIASVPVRLEVRKHAMRLSLWDVPSAVETGGVFRLSIGAKCSSGCDLTGFAFHLRGADGEDLGRGAFGGETLPGSEGLHLARIDVEAPKTAGRREVRVILDARDAPHPHEEAAASFRLRTVAPPDCTVRIEAVDVERQQPLANMSVVMHPYRGLTDENGLAELRVTRGAYTVFVSGRGYLPVKRALQVAGDVTARAPLAAQPRQSPDM